ncbi:MAG: hypothetical protein ABWX73_10245 [Marmoricola sp.]
MWLLLALSLALPQPAPPVEPIETRPALRAALHLLHDWDARREAAWAASDTGRLRRLYTPDSSAGQADARLLRAYTARGLVVRRLETQVFAVRVLRARPRETTLRVFDRVAGGEVVRAGKRRPLPSTRPALRDVTFRRSEGGWRVAEVSARGPGPRGSRH